MSRLLLLQAGLVAACIQCLAVGMATIVVLLALHHNLIVPAPPQIGTDIKSDLDALRPMLRSIYLLTALAVALTRDRFVDFTASRIRLASRLMHPSEPDHATKSVLAQFTFATIGLAVLALRPPPDLFIAVAGYFGCSWDAPIAWSGMMSIAMAGFGANAQAARRALRANRN